MKSNWHKKCLHFKFHDAGVHCFQRRRKLFTSLQVTNDGCRKFTPPKELPELRSGIFPSRSYASETGIRIRIQVNKTDLFVFFKSKIVKHIFNLAEQQIAFNTVDSTWPNFSIFSLSNYGWVQLGHLGPLCIFYTFFPKQC